LLTQRDSTMAKWTREQIIRDILQLESAGLPLTPNAEQGVNQALYQAASRMFGSWRNAVLAAGIAPERAQSHDRWPPGRILSIIRTMSRRRRPLRPGELKERHGSLVHAARRCFGSWSKAVIAAGVDPLKLRRVAPWTKERIIEAILTRALNNQPLGGRTVRPRSLADAGRRMFGSWASALLAAGLNPQSYLHREADTLDAAGLVPARGRSVQHRWSDQTVLEAILSRLREQRTMNAKAVYREDRPLYRAATRRYRNWSNALSAAGLNPNEFRKHKIPLSGGQIGFSNECSP
jgi:hypothetical protein